MAFPRLLSSLLLCLCLPSAPAQTAPSATAQSILDLNARLTSTASSARVSALAAPGRSLLQARHDLVVTLIKTHPEEARSILLPAAIAADLRSSSAQTAALIEQDTTLSGQLIATVADDFKHGTSTKQWHLQGRNRDIDLFGTVNPALLHQQVDAAGIAVDGVMAVTTLTPHRLDLSGSLNVGPAAVTNGTIPATCSTLGDQKVAVLVLKFADGPDYGAASASIGPVFNQYMFSSTGLSVTTAFQESSYGQTTASGDVYGPFTLPTTYDCTQTTEMRTAALLAAAASGTVDFSKYNHVMLAFPVNTCSFGGLADLGCRAPDAFFPTESGTIWMPIVPNGTSASIGAGGGAGNPDYYLVEGMAHEIGHNFGMDHANTLDFGSVPLGPIDFTATNPGTVGESAAARSDAAAADAPTRTNDRITAINAEYADNYDIMGAPYVAPGGFNAQHRTQTLGWIPQADHADILSGNRTVNLAPVEAASGLRGVRILRDARTSSWIWLEDHQTTTPYTTFNFTNFGGNINKGVQIHYEDGFNQSATGTRLLDMTPTGIGNIFTDGALEPGQIWSDPYSPWSIITNNVSTAGAQVGLIYDTPCATFTLNADTLPATAGTGTATITAPATCAWSAFANAPWFTLSGADNTGTVSGIGNATLNYSVLANPGTQRTTYLTVARQSQPITQSATNTTILGVSPIISTILPSQSQVFTLKITDALGLADVKQVNLVVSAIGNARPCIVIAALSAGKVNYFFNADGTGTPVVGGTTATGGSDSCTLSGAKSNVNVSNNTISVTYDLAFSKAFGGGHSIQAYVASNAQIAPLTNVGTLIVDATPGITLAPASIPIGATTPVVITGRNTSFSSASTIAISGTGVTATTPVATNATSLSTNLTVAADATLGARTLTITTGAEVATTTLNLIAKTATTTILTTPTTNVLPSATTPLTATVTGTAPTGTILPTGSIIFKDGATTLGTANLNAGVATFNAGPFAPGTHALTAVYAGDLANNGSTSAALAVISGTTTPAITVRAGSTAVFPGTAVQFTATATSATGTLIGNVTFTDGATVLGTAPLSSNGIATFTTASLTSGAHFVTASLPATTNFSAATSAAVNVNVSDFTLNVGTPNLTLFAGSTTGNSIALSVAPGVGGLTVPVTFACSNLPANTACAFAPSTLTPGTASAVTTLTLTTKPHTSTAPAVRAAAITGLMLLPALALIRTRRTRALLLVLLLSTGAVILNGCAGNSNNTSPSASTNPTTGTPAGTSNFTITATATDGTNTLTRAITVTLIVN